MKNQTKKTGSELGSAPVTPAMTAADLKTILSKDLDTLAALINFLRATPVALDAISEIAVEKIENKKQAEASAETLR